jgi:hypothetical protein
VKEMVKEDLKLAKFDKSMQDGNFSS